MDDHIVEPPTLWQERLPRHCRDDGPRVDRIWRPATVTYEMGAALQSPARDLPERWCDVWRYEAMEVPLDRSVTAVSFEESDVDVIATTYDEIRPGCFQLGARLADMDYDGVRTSVCYPNTFVRFAGQRFLQAQDKNLALLCVQAYTDCLIDDWNRDSGGRIVPACILPLWDVGDAAAEVNRIAGKGARVIASTELPTQLGLPSLHSGYWDPLLWVCQDASIVLSMHIGSGSHQLTTSDDAPLPVVGILNFSTAMMSLVDWLVSGRLSLFPNLRIAFAECQIGWIPYLLQRADQFAKSGWQAATQLSKADELPSDTFRRQVYVCFFDDIHGLASLDEIGSDNVCFETDYPHAGSTFPNSLAHAETLCADLSAGTVEEILRANALALLKI